jgi:selenocysteine lyase/cysteine desulfurase
VRLSVGAFTTGEEVQSLIDALSQISAAIAI